MLKDAAVLVVQNQQASVSLLQRKFRIGYSRAGRLVDELESSRDTIELATNNLQEDGKLNFGDRIVAVTGSPLAMTGVSNTIRLMRISDSGRLQDLE